MPAATHPLVSRENLAIRWRMAQGHIIRELRIGRGLTQADLAEELGYRNKQVISAIECGRINVPPDRLDTLAGALRVSLKDICRRLLRFQNPWLYAGLFGADAELAAELEAATEFERMNETRGPRK